MRGSRPRTAWVIVLGIMVAALLATVVLGGCGSSNSGSSGSSGSGGGTIKVGIVTPLSGLEAGLGKGMQDAATLWANQVNASGGLLGKKVQLLIQDDATNPTTAAAKAKLVIQDGADVVTGPILGTEWGAVRPVVNDQAHKILLQPVYYQGGWYNPLMFVTGEVPEQAVDSFVPWLMQNGYGNRWYFVGSDYDYPHYVNDMAKQLLVKDGGKSVGDEYAALGTTDFSSMLSRIAKAKPTMVFGNLVGTDAIAFMKQFYDAGLSKTIKMYEPIDQSFIPAIGVKQTEGVAVCQGYFGTINTPTNKAYVAAWTKLDPSIPPTDIPTSEYVALQLWAKAVQMAGTTNPTAVAAKMANLSLPDTPVGPVTLRAIDNHTVRNMYIAVVHNGVLQVVKNLGLMQPGVNQRLVHRT